MPTLVHSHTQLDVVVTNVSDQLGLLLPGGSTGWLLEVSSNPNNPMELSYGVISLSYGVISLSEIFILSFAVIDKRSQQQVTPTNQ